jgi:hypothetical protein
MATYIVSIEGSPRGSYNKVKSALAGAQHTYTKVSKTFAFEGDDDLYSAVLAAAGKEPEPDETTPTVEAAPVEEVVADPEPEPDSTPPPAEPAPAPSAPTWTIQAGGRSIPVQGDKCPSARVFAAKLGATSCTVLDADGKTADSWSA